MDTSNETAGAPVDLDEQCGVITDKNLACSRSLTCKTHGVGAKRAVPGRTKPFDTLLTEFQKRKENRMKQREKEAERQEKKLAANNANGISGDNGINSNNISIPSSITKASFDDGDDIAVPQAGSSSSHQIRLLSPSPLSSIPVPSPSAMDDVQVHQQQRQDHLQPSSQPPSRPHSNPTQQNQLSSASNVAVPPPSYQQPSNPIASAVPTLKTKPHQMSLPASNNASPSKSNATGANANSTTITTKKKKAGEGGKTGKNKTSARNKADLILGEIDDPPEPNISGAVSSTLVGSDGNLIVEEEAPDSDDEVDQILMAMNQSRARPLALPTFPPFERTPMKMAKYRESFLTAFTGRSMSSSAS